MDFQVVIDQFQKAASNANAIDGTLKFMLDGNTIYVDGSGDSNVVSTEDKDADTVITTSIETLEALRNGSLNPMMAVMGGKVKIKGDMGLAMKLQSLLS